MTTTDPPSYRQLCLGVFLGLALALGAISWLASAGSESAGESAAEQASIVTLSALTDVVNAAHATGRDVQDVMRRFTAGHEDIRWARVVDVRKRQLIASTVAADQAPRRLQRGNEDDKTWYDLGQSLRSAVDANEDEGRKRKEEILVERLEDGHLLLVAPLAYGGNVLGGVVVDALSEPVDLGRVSSPWLFLAVGSALFLVVGWVLRDKGRPLVIAAGVIVAATLSAYVVSTLGSLTDSRLAVEESVATRFVADLERTGGLGEVVSGLRPALWDTDRFRRPRGILSAEGVVDASVVDASFAQARGRFRNGFVLISFLGLGLAAFVGLGAAFKLVRTIIEHDEAYSFVAPAMIGMLVLVLFPFLFGLVLSFTHQTLYNLNEPVYSIWVGFENYVKILTDFDIVRNGESGGINYENFYWTLWITIAWTVTNVAIGVCVGMTLALILNTRGLALRSVYRVLLILPWAVPSYITALIWKGMLHQQLGTINQVLQIFGFEPISWFDNTFTSFCAMVATNSWLCFPFMMVVALGGLRSIPPELYEAARIDGANRWQQFVNVTLPSLKPVMVPAIMLAVVWTFNMFNVVYLVSDGKPGHATEILVTRAFKLFYEEYQYGYAAAYATVTFAILLVYGTWQNRMTKAGEGG